MKFLRAIGRYLSDWKNWLTHGLIGVSILLIAFFMPVKPIYRVTFLVLVVAFNLFRMRKERMKKAVEDQAD